MKTLSKDAFEGAKSTPEGRVNGRDKAMKVMFLGLMMLICMIPGVMAETIEGNMVYVDDAQIYFSATPHTIKTGDDMVQFRLISKAFTGEIDVAFGFDTNDIKPKSAEYWNGANWIDISNAFDRIDRDYQEMNAWYVTEEVNVNAGQIYDFRVNYQLSPPVETKYWACVKPSAQTLNEAIAGGNFYCLDPWANVSYIHKNEIWGNIASLSQPTTGLIPINVTLNTTQLFWCNLTVSPTNSTIGWVYWNSDTDFECYNANETEAVTTIMDESNGQDKGTKPTDLKIFHTFGGCSSTSCEDRSSYNNDASKTVSGTPYNITGITGNGQECSGTRNQGFTVTDSDSLHFDSGESWSTSVWIRPDTPLEAYSAIYDTGQNYVLFLDNARTITSQHWYAANDYIIATTPVSPVNYGSGWYHLANVFDASTNATTTYVNGNNITVSSTTYGNNARVLTNNLYICYNYGTTALNGGIDNLMFYEDALTDDEVKLLYNSQLSPFPYGATQNSTYVPPEPEIPPALTGNYRICQGDFLVIQEAENITVNGVVNETITINEYRCDNGCSNTSLLNLGYAGCVESDIVQIIIVILICIVVIAFVRWFVDR